MYKYKNIRELQQYPILRIVNKYSMIVSGDQEFKDTQLHE